VSGRRGSIELAVNLSIVVAAVLGLGAVAGIAVAYVNRDALQDRPLWRQRLPYASAALILIVVAIGIAVLLTNDHTHVGSLAR
jgi:hypothetical protein